MTSYHVYNNLKRIIIKTAIVRYILITIRLLKIFFAGGLGQLGQSLASKLRLKYGRDNVLLTDVRKPVEDLISNGECLSS